MRARPRIRVFGIMIDVVVFFILLGVGGFILLGYLVNSHPGILVLLLFILFARVWQVKSRS